MNRLSELKENRKLDNKGFSLVELIIVIAIMAVLIGVLAPQYLKYVERSRQSADLDSINTMIHALEIYNADPATTTFAEGTISAEGVNKQVSAHSTIQSALSDSGMDTLPTMKSKEYGTDWEITVDSTGWEITSDTANTKLAVALGR